MAKVTFRSIADYDIVSYQPRPSKNKTRDKKDKSKRIKLVDGKFQIDDDPFLINQVENARDCIRGGFLFERVE